MTGQAEADVLTTIEDGIAIVVMNRPDRRNALNPSLMKNLNREVAQLAEDETVRVLILTGAREAFCAGGDIKDAAERSAWQPVAVRQAHLRACMEVSRHLHEMPKPTIAMIPGAAAGAGLSLAGACDLRIASDKAVFLSAFGSVGLSGDYGGSYFWTRILGTAKARELYFLGEKISAAEALKFGLVNRVTSPDRLRSTTLELAAVLKGHLQPALGFMKQNLNAAEHASLSDVLDLEAANMMLSGIAISDAHRASKKGKDEGR